MINAIIIDDEQHCINRLNSLVTDYFAKKINIAAVSKTVEGGLTVIKEFKPQLVFLDVQIGDKTGFDLLTHLHNINFEIIFTTAYEKYAVQAFKFSAIDYLLKPIDADDLKQAVEKLGEKISLKESAGKLDVLFHNLKNIQGISKRICVPVLNGLVFLQVSDIVRCESEINYTNIFLHDKKKILVSKTLKDFEEMLAEHNFFRVHNSHLINLAYLKSYNRGKGGTVTMADGSQIDVSTRRKEEFLKKLLS